MNKEQIKKELIKLKEIFDSFADNCTILYEEKTQYQDVNNKFNEILQTIEQKESEEKEILYDLSGMKPSEKTKLIEGFTEISAEHAMKLFYMLGLNTHFETKLINDANGDEFIFSLKKI